MQGQTVRAARRFLARRSFRRFLISSIVTSFIMAVSCSVIFDFAAMLDVERSALLLMSSSITFSTACGCAAVSRCSLCVRRNKWRVARPAGGRGTALAC